MPRANSHAVVFSALIFLLEFALRQRRRLVAAVLGCGLADSQTDDCALAVAGFARIQLFPVGLNSCESSYA